MQTIPTIGTSQFGERNPETVGGCVLQYLNVCDQVFLCYVKVASLK